MDVPKEAKSPLSAPLKGLRSILSFFPHSSRLSDTVVQSGLAVSDARPSKRYFWGKAFEFTTSDFESEKLNFLPFFHYVLH